MLKLNPNARRKSYPISLADNIRLQLHDIQRQEHEEVRSLFSRLNKSVDGRSWYTQRGRQCQIEQVRSIIDLLPWISP
jgi:hypothetical protein